MTPVRASLLLTAVSLIASSCAGSEPAVPVGDAARTPTPVAPAESQRDDVTLPRLGDQPVTQLLAAADPAEIELPRVQNAVIPGDEGQPETNTSPPTNPAGTNPSATTPQPVPLTEPNSQSPSSTSPSPPGATAAPQDSAAPTAFPPSMAAIRGGEEILLIDTSTGNSTSVALFSLVVDEENKVGPPFPFSVDVDPVAVGVRYDTCCDPQGSATTFVDLTSGLPGTAISGGLPSVSPNGSKLALSNIETVDIVDVVNGSTSTLAKSGEQWFVGRTSWSPNGATIAVEVLAPTLDAPAIALVDPTMPNLDSAKVLEAPGGYAWTLPSFRADGNLVVLETSISATGAKPRVVVVDHSGIAVETIDLAGMDGVLDIDHDVSGYWLLVVDSDGGAFWFGPGSSGRLPGSGFTSASW